MPPNRELLETLSVLHSKEPYLQKLVLFCRSQVSLVLGQDFAWLWAFVFSLFGKHSAHLKQTHASFLFHLLAPLTGRVLHPQLCIWG